jgi:hypothetical protein
MINHKSGIELITEERNEHVEKHGFDSIHDKNNSNGELAQAAAYLLSLEFYNWPGNEGWVDYPDSWSYEYQDKLRKKSKIDRLKIAGSLIAAEIDRLLEERKE